MKLVNKASLRYTEVRSLKQGDIIQGRLIHMYPYLFNTYICVIRDGNQRTELLVGPALHSMIAEVPKFKMINIARKDNALSSQVGFETLVYHVSYRG